MATLPDTMSQEDPWAWLAWAQQRDPETYGWDTIKGASDPFSGGPAWWAGPVAEGADPHATMTPEQAQAMADAGYTFRQARGPDYTKMWQVVDPSGKVIDQNTFQKQDGLHTKDWVTLASVLAAGYGGASALGSAGVGAGVGAGAGAATTAGTAATTAGAPAAGGINWGAIGNAAAKSAALNGGMTLAQGGDLSDALKSAAMGAVTGGAGGAIAQAGLNPILAGAATGAVGSAARGGDGSDVLRSGLLGGASGALNQWQPTDSVAGNAAIRSGAMTLAQGGDLKQGLLNAATAGGGKLLDSAVTGRSDTVSSGPQRVSASFGDNLDTSGYGTFTGGNALTFTPSAEGSTTVNDDFDWNTYDYPSDVTKDYSGYNSYDPLTDSGGGVSFGNDTATGEPGPGTNWGDWLKNLLGSKNGKVTFAGVDFSGGDLLKLFAAGGAAAYNSGKTEDMWNKQRQTALEDQAAAIKRQDEVYAKQRADALTDRDTNNQRQDELYAKQRTDLLTDRDTARAQTEADLLAARKRRAPVSGGLLMPQLVRRGP
jgi:hypothetical protein